jgi:hypothetical protein
MKRGNRGKRENGEMRNAVADFSSVFDPYRRARRVNRIPDLINMRPVEKDGGFVIAHEYWIYFLEGAQDFPKESTSQWGNLIAQIFEIMRRADAGDEEAKDNLNAIERTVFAGPLGMSRNALKSIAETPVRSLADACAWLWYDLIQRIADVVLPTDPAKDTATDNVSLRDDLPDHPLVQYVRAFFKPGKVNTSKSLARQVLKSLLAEVRIHSPTLDYIDKELNRLLEDSRSSAEISAGHIERLRIEGFDYYLTMYRKGFNRAVPERG